MGKGKHIQKILRLINNETTLNYSLRISPRVLIYPEEKLAMLWSAKAGSLTIIPWFFHQMGLLEEADSMFTFIHQYRIKVYYHTPLYKKNIPRIVKDNYRIIKVVRNPFTRAVSSYIHAISYGYENKLISKYLQRIVDGDNSFSFAEFLDYLKNGCDIKRCNIHHQRQYHPLEENSYVRVDYLVYLEDYVTRFAELEKELGLKTFDFQVIRNPQHHTKKVNFNSYCGNISFTKSMIKKGQKVPEYKDFYIPELQNLVLEIYKDDFEHYNFCKTFL